jgi:hypothetical protein
MLSIEAPDPRFVSRVFSASSLIKPQARYRPVGPRVQSRVLTFKTPMTGRIPRYLEPSATTLQRPNAGRDKVVDRQHH